MSKFLAKFFSYLLHPALFPILGVFTVLKLPPFIQSSKVIMLTVALVFCGTYLIPVVVSLLLYRLKVVSSLLMVEARDRRLPYAFSALSFYATALVLRNIEILHEAYLFLLASALVIIIHLFMLNFTKPSAHLAGIGGFLGLLMAISAKYGINLLPIIGMAFFLSGILAASRFYLKAHTWAEIIFGFASGWIIIFLILYFY